MKIHTDFGPVPASSHGEEEGLDMANVIESLADALVEAGPVVRRFEARAAHNHQHQLQSLQGVHSAMVRHQDDLHQVTLCMGRMELGLRNLLEEYQKRTEATALLVQRLDALEHNTEQVRRVADTIAEKQPHLVNDFIERHVTDHLFKEFFNIQSALARYSANGNPNLRDDIQATAAAIEAFLDEPGLRIINPRSGAAFEPREHLPVKVLPVLDAQADGTIAETFTPGLSRSHRVIQQARVAVFKANGMKTVSQQTTNSA